MAKRDQVTMNISMPPPMQLYVKEAVERGQYGTVSEYIRHLIRQDQNHNPAYQLEQKLLAAIDSPDSTDQDFLNRLRDIIRSKPM